MSDRPNIAFLLNDHQVYYRHGWDDGPNIQRPHFDRLAAGGVVFDRAYAACPLCGPARRTMLTGLYPHTHGELKNDSNHPFDRETYLDILADGGYRSYYYGKWHAGEGTAYDHGCEGFSYPSYNNPYTKPEYREYLAAGGLPEHEVLIERNFWPPVGRDGRPSPMQAGERYKCEGSWCNEHASGLTVTPTETHEAFFLADLACGRLQDLAASASHQPWALRVDFWGPHQPYFPTREFADLYSAEDIPEYPSFRDDLSTKPEIYRSEGNHPISEDGKLISPNPLPWPEWQKVLARAYAHVTMVDAAGGMILDALDELGLADNTLVLWTTDHGDALACHGGHFDKRSYMPEEMIRIPMAMRWPGRVAPGRVSQSLVSNLDVAPTILDAAGLGFADEVDGASLVPLGTDANADWREDVVCETHGHGEEHLGRAVVADRYKYVANKGQMDELYDLAEDPYEMVNLIADPACGDVLSDMQQRLSRWQEGTSDPH
ncbi:MAG: sulfatase-like hydrolase/transferase [Armatimonadota bacterium]|jgi:arylsulfatase A-like enzyme